MDNNDTFNPPISTDTSNTSSAGSATPATSSTPGAPIATTPETVAEPTDLFQPDIATPNHSSGIDEIFTASDIATETLASAPDAPQANIDAPQADAKTTQNTDINTIIDNANPDEFNEAIRASISQKTKDAEAPKNLNANTYPDTTKHESIGEVLEILHEVEAKQKELSVAIANLKSALTNLQDATNS